MGSTGALALQDRGHAAYLIFRQFTVIAKNDGQPAVQVDTHLGGEL